jgi:hypothetical protein
VNYPNGLEVKEGDTVAVNIGGSISEGVVLKIILPSTEDSLNWSVPQGGALIEGAGFGLLAVEDLQDDEDVVFVRRAGRAV